MTIQYRGVKVTSNNSSQAKPFAGNYRGTQYTENTMEKSPKATNGIYRGSKWVS